MSATKLTAYLAADGLLEQVLAEVGPALQIHGRLVIVGGELRPSYWSQNIWYSPEKFEFESIGQAVKYLRGIQRNWALYSESNHRRATLIQEQLSSKPFRPLIFGEGRAVPQLGSWTLLDKNTLLAAPNCAQRFPHGEVHFVEDKSGPPNRAYLKLWEIFTRLEQQPKPGETCLDVGASPGGWTWVLASLGARVTSVDRAALDAPLQNHPNVQFQKGDAFSITPELSDADFDWIFCDVACFPDKLLEWILLWVRSGKVRNMVCTLKFQGDKHYGLIPEFAAIPQSKLVHLFHNKHELTFVWMADHDKELRI